MASYVDFVPTTPISRAMFNFDMFGQSDFRLLGTIRVSTSDSFSFYDYLYSGIYSELYTNGSEEVFWQASTIANINEILGIYSSFANLTFQWVGDFDSVGYWDSTANPADVGLYDLSDININWINRAGGSFAGISGINNSSIFGYIGGAGDVFLNTATSKFNGDYSFSLNTFARQVLMHELGHSLGLSHPHYSIVNGQAAISADYAATANLGFAQLGFRITGAQDMYKEYFSIMTYDDHVSMLPGDATVYQAHTPMILDVIALQQAYGEGGGTTGSGNDVIQTGTAGYRTYFDPGGIDTIDMSAYVNGAYLHMGVAIADAAHLVGVGMSYQDGVSTITYGGDPSNLRWFYGEFENATMTGTRDLVYGNRLANTIYVLGGDDAVYAGAGGDTIYGGPGNDIIAGQDGEDMAMYSGQRAGYRISRANGSLLITDLVAADGDDGTDTLTGIEWAHFSDGWVSVIDRTPTLTPTGVGVGIGLSRPVTDLIQYVDPDGDPIVTYEFWDSTAQGGYFRLAGQIQLSGRAISISPGQLANLVYVGGTSISSETLWSRAYDGQEWGEWASWSQRTIRATNVAPIATFPNRTMILGQWVQGTSLGLTVSDGDGDVPTTYEFRDGDSSAGSARFWYDGQYLAQGATFSVRAEDLGNFWIQASESTRTESIGLRVNDGFVWSATVSANLTSRPENRAPTVLSRGVAVALNSSSLVTSLISATDLDGDSIVAYRFWDPAGGGYFTLSGQVQAAARTFEVATANIGNLRYTGGNVAGAEVIWAQAYDGQAWGEWYGWTQQTNRAGNVLPTISVSGRNLELGAWVAAIELGIRVTDPDGDAPVQFQLSDGNLGATSARLWMNGAYLAQGTTVTLAAADLQNLWIQAASTRATDPFSIRVNDGYGWSSSTTFNLISRERNLAPAVAGAGVAAAINTPVAATSIISVTDANGDSPTFYRFWDPAGGGVFKLSGVTQASNQNIDVAAASIANLAYTGGVAMGRETLWAQVYDGEAWSAWASWDQWTARAGNTAPTMTAPNQSIGVNEWRLASALSGTYADANGDAAAALRVRDATAGGARLWYGGDYLAEGQTHTFTAATFANLWVQGGAAAGANTLEVSASDGMAWGATSTFTLSTRASNQTPTAASRNVSARVNTAATIGTLVNVTDPDGDAITAYQFWDSAGGGFLRLNGVAQPVGGAIDVTPGNLGNLSYVGGASPGTETLWVRANDGTAWGNWFGWSQTTIA